ncbi:unnamed protein product, partial [Didymodactylos carnosus]
VFIHNICSDKEFTNVWGTFQTPHFPNPYNPHDDCWCKLSTQRKHRILLSVIVFQLIPYDHECAGAGLYLQSSDTQRSTQCTYLNQGHNYLSDTNELYINFYSHTPTVRGGFWIIYEASNVNGKVHLQCGSMDTVYPHSSQNGSPRMSSLSPISTGFDNGWARLAFNSLTNTIKTTTISSIKTNTYQRSDDDKIKMLRLIGGIAEESSDLLDRNFHQSYDEKNEHQIYPHKIHKTSTISPRLLSVNHDPYNKDLNNKEAAAFSYSPGSLSTFELAWGSQGWYLNFPSSSSISTRLMYPTTTRSTNDVVAYLNKTDQIYTQRNINDTLRLLNVPIVQPTKSTPTIIKWNSTWHYGYTKRITNIQKKSSNNPLTTQTLHAYATNSSTTRRIIDTSFHTTSNFMPVDSTTEKSNPTHNSTSKIREKFFTTLASNFFYPILSSEKNHTNSTAINTITYTTNITTTKMKQLPFDTSTLSSPTTTARYTIDYSLLNFNPLLFFSTTPTTSKLAGKINQTNASKPEISSSTITIPPPTPWYSPQGPFDWWHWIWYTKTTTTTSKGITKKALILTSTTTTTIKQTTAINTTSTIISATTRTTTLKKSYTNSSTQSPETRKVLSYSTPVIIFPILFPSNMTSTTDRILFVTKLTSTPNHQSIINSTIRTSALSTTITTHTSGKTRTAQSHTIDWFKFPVIKQKHNSFPSSHSSHRTHSFSLSSSKRSPKWKSSTQPSTTTFDISGIDDDEGEGDDDQDWNSIFSKDASDLTVKLSSKNNFLATQSTTLIVETLSNRYQANNERNALPNNVNSLMTPTNVHSMIRRVIEQRNKKVMENRRLSKTDITIIAVCILFVILLVIINLILYAVRRHRHQLQRRHLISPSLATTIVGTTGSSMNGTSGTNTMPNNSDILPAVGEIVIWGAKDQRGYMIDNNGTWAKIEGRQWFGSNIFKGCSKSSLSKSFRSKFRVRSDKKEIRQAQLFKCPLLMDSATLSPVPECDYESSELSLSDTVLNGISIKRSKPNFINKSEVKDISERLVKNTQVLVHTTGSHDQLSSRYSRQLSNSTGDYYKRISGGDDSNYTLGEDMESSLAEQDTDKSENPIVTVPILIRDCNSPTDTTYDQNYSILSVVEYSSTPVRPNYLQPRHHSHENNNTFSSPTQNSASSKFFLNSFQSSNTAAATQQRSPLQLEYMGSSSGTSNVTGQFSPTQLDTSQEAFKIKNMTLTTGYCQTEFTPLDPNLLLKNSNLFQTLLDSSSKAVTCDDTAEHLYRYSQSAQLSTYDSGFIDDKSDQSIVSSSSNLSNTKQMRPVSCPDVQILQSENEKSPHIDLVRRKSFIRQTSPERCRSLSGDEHYQQQQLQDEQNVDTQLEQLLERQRLNQQLQLDDLQANLITTADHNTSANSPKETKISEWRSTIRSKLRQIVNNPVMGKRRVDTSDVESKRVSFPDKHVTQRFSPPCQSPPYFGSTSQEQHVSSAQPAILDQTTTDLSNMFTTYDLSPMSLQKFNSNGGFDKTQLGNRMRSFFPDYDEKSTTVLIPKNNNNRNSPEPSSLSDQTHLQMSSPVLRDLFATKAAIDDDEDQPVIMKNLHSVKSLKKFFETRMQRQGFPSEMNLSPASFLDNRQNEQQHQLNVEEMNDDTHEQFYSSGCLISNPLPMTDSHRVVDNNNNNNNNSMIDDDKQHLISIRTKLLDSLRRKKRIPITDQISQSSSTDVDNDEQYHRRSTTPVQSAIAEYSDLSQISSHIYVQQQQQNEQQSIPSFDHNNHFTLLNNEMESHHLSTITKQSPHSRRFRSSSSNSFENSLDILQHQSSSQLTRAHVKRSLSHDPNYSCSNRSSNGCFIENWGQDTPKMNQEDDENDDLVDDNASESSMLWQAKTRLQTFVKTTRSEYQQNNQNFDQNTRSNINHPLYRGDNRCSQITSTNSDYSKKIIMTETKF